MRNYWKRLTAMLLALLLTAAPALAWGQKSGAVLRRPPPIALLSYRGQGESVFASQIVPHFLNCAPLNFEESAFDASTIK